MAAMKGDSFKMQNGSPGVPTHKHTRSSSNVSSGGDMKPIPKRFSSKLLTNLTVRTPLIPLLLADDLSFAVQIFWTEYSDSSVSITLSVPQTVLPLVQNVLVRMILYGGWVLLPGKSSWLAGVHLCNLYFVVNPSLCSLWLAYMT